MTVKTGQLILVKDNKIINLPLEFSMVDLQRIYQIEEEIINPLTNIERAKSGIDLYGKNDIAYDLNAFINDGFSIVRVNRLVKTINGKKCLVTEKDMDVVIGNNITFEDNQLIINIIKRLKNKYSHNIINYSAYRVLPGGLVTYCMAKEKNVNDQDTFNIFMNDLANLTSDINTNELAK